MNENRSICLGCHQFLEGAESWCPCVDAENERMAQEVEDWQVAHPGHTGFAGFIGQLPVRASLKALDKFKAQLTDSK